MKDKIAEKILKMEKDKLMSKPESDRDWELITAIDIAIKALEREAEAVNIKMSEEEIKQFKQMLQEHTPLYTITSDNAPTVDITEEQAIDKLHETGWLPKHDKEMTERPTGEWIIEPHSMIMRCSLCGNEETAKSVGTINDDKHFCSNCGAKMRKEKED